MGEEEGLTKFDFFRYTPKKFLEQTVLGAILSLSVLIIGGVFVYNRVDEAFGNGIKTELLFEDLRMTDVEVNMDIDLIHIPCEMVDLRFTSKQGATHTIDRYHLSNAKKGVEV
jgi:Endoplasmic Reticulum-Golgi Intermediate Compartment (ERGIC)/Endoplasmic reticulum vesicle transporter